MAKGKLAKFAEIKTMPHVFENRDWHHPDLYNHKNETINYAGKWATLHFGNQHPILLELACGYGEYTTAIARLYPDKNVIGIDLKGNRIWTGAKFAQMQLLTNAAFIRSQVELIEHYFGKGEIAEIWLPFPDPQKERPKKRLTSTRYIELYRNILQPEGIIHLKTDSDVLYESTLEVIIETGCKIVANYPDLYHSPLATNPLLSVTTRYERLNLSGATTIKYLSFTV
ncbi:MAG TPA: tRNA (guanosine(46)-N7)-methyltransferase TrmB [Chitinophagales bacterium]|nr:tRNA (guanosine(46)-N7)-methyltransferase TrmB [Chitinophagales bacterium]HRK26646.1 tRNA (guanosine(46)-N7)-methyltransferase TrmB [Chitinophagales bacterium]